MDPRGRGRAGRGHGLLNPDNSSDEEELQQMQVPGRGIRGVIRRPVPQLGSNPIEIGERPPIRIPRQIPELSDRFADVQISAPSVPAARIARRVEPESSSEADSIPNAPGRGRSRGIFARGRSVECGTPIQPGEPLIRPPTGQQAGHSPIPGQFDDVPEEAQVSQRSPVREPSPKRSPVPEPSPKRSPVPEPSPKRSPVPEPSPQRSPVHEPSPQRSPVREPSPQRSPVHEPSPQRSPVPEPERAQEIAVAEPIPVEVQVNVRERPEKIIPIGAPGTSQERVTVSSTDIKPIVPADLPPLTMKGEKGMPIELSCNFIRMKYNMKKKVSEYHVEFDPPIDAVKFRRRALDQFAEQIGSIRNFDGAMLFLPVILEDKKLILKGHHPNDPNESLKVTIVFVKQKEARDLIQFMNILFRKIMRVLNRVELRRNYYDLTSVRVLAQHKLEIWPGQAIAIEEREGGLMICLDSSHRVLRTETVYEYYCTIKDSCANWKVLYENFIIGKIVLTRYNNKCYKIDDIMWGTNPSCTFARRDKEISYVEYYRVQYGKEISDPEQPLLLSRIKPRRNDVNQEEKAVALVPELCYVTGLTDEQKSNFSIMKDLGEHTRLQPHQRKTALKKFIANVTTNPEAAKILAEWNMKLDVDPVSIFCRQIEAPKLSFGKLINYPVKADFSRESGNNCHEPRDIQSYLMICTQRDADKARKFVDTYLQVAQALAIKTIQGGTIMPIRGQQVNDFRRAIKDNLGTHQFLVVLMPQQRDDLYGMIKKTCVSELGIPSQCILTKTLSNEKRFKSIVQKIALQINCKLGGSLWSLSMPLNDQIMFVGIDVAHDPLKKQASVLALVANLNNDCTKYFSVVRTVKVHAEIADNLESAFNDILEEYYIVRGCNPHRIIVWRDGGSISSMDFFKEHEAVQMQKAIASRGFTPKFSFVVIQKRISQRFFLHDRTDWKNPEPGTIVDHTVTNRHTYDFFVVSQLVRQGTVTPTHYVVVTDTGATKPDVMQKFAYATSFMYYNWPGTIRVPAMTQYAHKLCGLIHAFVRADPGESLVRTLYYL